MLGLPPFHKEEYLERLRTLPKVAPVILPIDLDGDWVAGRLVQVWKRFREADAFQQGHQFERTYGATIRGKTIGIIGLGAIGCAVSERMRAFGCRILGIKRSARVGASSEHAEVVYRPEQLHEMLALWDLLNVDISAHSSVSVDRYMEDLFAMFLGNLERFLRDAPRQNLIDLEGSGFA